MPVAIGIDLGSAYSSIAAFCDGDIVMIPDGYGRLRIPSRTDSYPLDPMIDEQKMTMILSRLKAQAEAITAQQVLQAVITVPASYGVRQRQKTRNAGLRAGFRDLQLLNAPTAAAIGHWFDTGKPDTHFMLVLDVGASRAEVTLLDVTNGRFEAQSTAGDCRLGGHGYDAQLLNHCLSSAQYSIPSSPATRPLHEACEQVKKTLSFDTSSHLDSSILITRDQFEGICEGIFSLTVDLVAKALQDALIAKSDIEEVVLIGGSSKIPKLRQTIADYFGWSANDIRSPHMACLRGAVVKAASLSGISLSEELIVLDIFPFPLHIALPPSCRIQVLAPNTNIPHESTIPIAYTWDDAQHLQIEEEGQVRSVLGVFALTGLCPWLKPGGQQTIEVKVSVDLDGILDASLVVGDPTTGMNITVPMEESYVAEEQHQTNRGYGGSLASYITVIENLSQSLSSPQREVLQDALHNARFGRDSNDGDSVLERLIRAADWAVNCPTVSDTDSDYTDSDYLLME